MDKDLGISEFFDLFLLVMFLAISMISYTFMYTTIKKDRTMYELEDKTALRQVVDNAPIPYQWTTRDIILMLVTTDGYHPKLANGLELVHNGNVMPTLYLDKDFSDRKETLIQSFYIDHLHGLMNNNVSDFMIDYSSGTPKWRLIVQ